MHFANLMMAMEDAVGEAVTNFPISSTDLSVVKDTVFEAMKIAAPAGIAILGISLGVTYVPKMLKKLGK